MLYPFLKFLIYKALAFSKFFENQYHRVTDLAKKALLPCTVIIIASQISACNINVIAGNKPNIDALENTLELGVSTEQDVLNTLGTPAGEGREMMPFVSEPRKAWTYYYAEGDLTDSRGLFLFVFFANQRYDGYMWFSSLPEFKPKLGN